MDALLWQNQEAHLPMDLADLVPLTMCSVTISKRGAVDVSLRKVRAPLMLRSGRCDETSVEVWTIWKR
jgi:hypothetical protein